jgi:heptaprenyl diphosphate synthase
MESYQIQQIAKKFTQYDMIQAHTDLPEFPTYRTSLLYVFLKNGALTTNHDDENIHELYSLVTSLVQMGMDTHDMVEVENDQSNLSKMRSNQLKVLAGDYFSSRFYQLLAQKGQVEMIQTLSAAICEVNRLKMNLYLNMQKMRMTAEEFLQESIQIRMQLFTPFSKFMKEVFAQKWSELLYGFTRCEVISEQLDLNEDESDIKESWFYSDSELTVMLDKQISSVLKQVGQLESENMIKELNWIGESFLRYLTVPRVLEEI